MMGAIAAELAKRGKQQPAWMAAAGAKKKPKKKKMANKKRHKQPISTTDEDGLAGTPDEEEPEPTPPSAKRAKRVTKQLEFTKGEELLAERKGTWEEATIIGKSAKKVGEWKVKFSSDDKIFARPPEHLKGMEEVEEERQDSIDIHDIAVGFGISAKSGSRVRVLYEGFVVGNHTAVDLHTEKALRFEACTSANKPLQFPVGAEEVIHGLEQVTPQYFSVPLCRILVHFAYIFVVRYSILTIDCLFFLFRCCGQGVIGMQPGGERSIIIPPSLGYGDTAHGAKIPPNATLRFVVTLIGYY